MKLTRLDCVSLYVDGWRDVVILSHGSKWIVGFTAATLETVKLPALIQTEHTKRLIPQPHKPLGYSRTRLARRLRRNAKTYPHTKTIAHAIADLGRRAPSSDCTEEHVAL